MGNAAGNVNERKRIKNYYLKGLSKRLTREKKSDTFSFVILIFIRRLSKEWLRVFTEFKPLKETKFVEIDIILYFKLPTRLKGY